MPVRVMAKAIVGFALLLTALAGCASDPMLVGPRVPDPYRVIGPVDASACGFLLFDCIPVRMNRRPERAYREALALWQGKALIDTEVRERWYYVGIGELLCTDIKGTAVQ